MGAIKKINQHYGFLIIPKKLRQQLPSDTVKLEIKEIDGKKVLIATPVTEDKKAITVYE